MGNLPEYVEFYEDQFFKVKTIFYIV